MTVPSSHLHYLSRLHPADFAVMYLSHSLTRLACPFHLLSFHLVLCHLMGYIDPRVSYYLLLLPFFLFPRDPLSNLTPSSSPCTLTLTETSKQQKKAFYLLAFLSTSVGTSVGAE